VAREDLNMFTLARHAKTHLRRHTLSPLKPLHQSFSSPSLPTLIKKLRESTQAPISECKRALEASELSLPEAHDWLRTHGSKRVSEKVGKRDTNQGLVGLSITSDGYAMVKIKSETDFASRSEKFTGFVELVAARASSLETVESVLEDAEVKERMEEVMLSMRENLAVDSVRVVRSKGESMFVGYVHSKAPGSQLAGGMVSVVELASKGKDEEELNAHGKGLAMHVVAASPKYLDAASIPEEILEKERAIFRDQLEGSQKPPDIVKKILDGKMRKYFESVCFVDQPHMIEEGNPKISKFLKGKGIELLSFDTLGM